MTLSLIDRLFYKEVTGRVIERNDCHYVFGNRTSTNYTILDDKDKKHYVALPGYHSEPRTGDRVKIVLDKTTTMANLDLTERIENPEGSVEFITRTIYYYPLVKYQVLEDKLDEAAPKMKGDE